jgi:pimeloyl-ACP methyl ester carboxylesterase
MADALARRWRAPLAIVTAATAVALADRPVSTQPAPPAAAERREGHVEVPGARLFYIDSGGAGPAVVLLHAGTGSARVWEHQWAPLGQAGHRVIAYDRRGHGRTTTDPSSPPIAAADDLHALAATLRLDRFHLVGTAAGGIVAIDFALTYPERLRSLVVANSLGGVTDETYLTLGRRLRPPAFAALPPDLRELGPEYRAANPDGTDRWLALERASRAPGPPPPPQPSRQRVTFQQLEGLRVPTLLLTGGADMYTPPAALQLFAARIPGASTLVVPDVGHSAYWEAPAVFNQAVLAFVGRH